MGSPMFLVETSVNGSEWTLLRFLLGNFGEWTLLRFLLGNFGEWILLRFLWKLRRMDSPSFLVETSANGKKKPCDCRHTA